jgi:hypothetical protein
LSIEVEVLWSASTSLLLVGFVSSGSYSYPYFERSRSSNLINAISLEEEVRTRTGGMGRSQSKPTHAKGIREAG